MNNGVLNSLQNILTTNEDLQSEVKELKNEIKNLKRVREETEKEISKNILKTLKTESRTLFSVANYAYAISLIKEESDPTLLKVLKDVPLKNGEQGSLFDGTSWDITRCDPQVVCELGLAVAIDKIKHLQYESYKQEHAENKRLKDLQWDIAKQKDVCNELKRCLETKDEEITKLNNEKKGFEYLKKDNERLKKERDDLKLTPGALLDCMNTVVEDTRKIVLSDLMKDFKTKFPSLKDHEDDARDLLRMVFKYLKREIKNTDLTNKK